MSIYFAPDNWTTCKNRTHTNNNRWCVTTNIKKQCPSLIIFYENTFHLIEWHMDREIEREKASEWFAGAMITTFMTFTITNFYLCSTISIFHMNVCVCVSIVIWLSSSFSITIQFYLGKWIQAHTYTHKLDLSYLIYGI